MQTCQVPSPPSTARESRPLRLMALELQTGGHHPSYVRNFANQWVRRDLPAHIDFVVSRRFFELHREVVDEVSNLDPQRVAIHWLGEAEGARFESNARLRDFRAWRIFCEYAEKLEIDRAMLMYSDHFQLPMVLGRTSPCPYSCVYFRPTFHYGQLADYHPTFKQRVAALRKKLLLQRVLKLPQLETLFCMDALAADYIRAHMPSDVLITTLPDSFSLPPTPPGRVEELRRELGIEQGRRILMSLGVLDRRKGPLQLLAAVKALPTEAQAKLCLLMIGKLDESLEADALAEIAWINANTPTQVVSYNHYIPDTQVQPYYELADVALTTYQGHMGMSSALIRSALAEIPLLSASYGLMGHMVRQHRLGAVVDTTSPAAFTEGIRQVIEADLATLFDRETALAFAAQYTPEALGQTLADWVARSEAAVGRN